VSEQKQLSLLFLSFGVGVAGLPHPTLGLGNSLLCWFRLFSSCGWDGESGIFTCKLCWDGWDGMGEYVEKFPFLPMQEQYLIQQFLFSVVDAAIVWGTAAAATAAATSRALFLKAVARVICSR
jgi:hypothetical protein